MQSAKCQIVKRSKGWSVVPVNDNAKQIVAILYGWDNFSELEQDESFVEGISPEDSIEKFLAHVVHIAKDTKHLSISVCGSKSQPTLLIWDKAPAARQEPEKIRVDLKWSCWSVDKGHWDQYAPGVWERMRAAFEGTQGPVEISTGPRKEIRFGTVTIEKGRASGYFYTEWDDVDSLADTLGLTDEDGNWKLPEEDREELLAKYGQEKLNEDSDFAFRESIPFSMHSYEPGMDHDFEIRARSFAKLMERVDAEEDALLQEDKKEWNLIEEIYRNTQS